MPRGGAQEVGRSAYQVDTTERTYLVDFGIGQTDPISYPSFQDLDQGQVDAVFLTHAHIDHTGALPLLEHKDYLAPSAKIFATQPTASLSEVLLYDSLKLHKMDVEQKGIEQRYFSEDVEKVLERFEPASYGGGVLDGDFVFKFGDAGHLLGSAWLLLEYDGRRVIFSGDLGGRSAHLNDIEEPNSADALFLESTYGNRHQHPSFDDARTELYESALESAKNGQPVLIPTFATGRAQEILQIFRERLPNDAGKNLKIVYDGMIEDTLSRYHLFAQQPYMNKSIENYRLNSKDPQPLLPDIAYQPKTMEERQEIFQGDKTPIIIAPNGMLEGGFSLFYLHRMVMEVDDANIFLVGYQAEGTTGHKLQGRTDDVIEVTVTVQMEPEYADATGVGEFGFHERKISVPNEWIQTIDGFSGHGDANTLLEFARHIDPENIFLIHGNPSAQSQFVEHIEKNMDTTAEPAEEGAQYNIEWADVKDEIEVDRGLLDDATPDVYDTEPTKDDEEMSSPFTAAEEQRIREIVNEELDN